MSRNIVMLTMISLGDLATARLWKVNSYANHKEES